MNASQAPATPTRWSRMAGLGLAMAALAPLLMFTAGLIWGLDGEDAPFFLITAAIALVGAFVVLRFPAIWAKVVGIVASVLVIGAMFWTIFGLFAPTSFFDFVPGLLVVPGGILGIAGSVAGIVAIRRGKAAAAPAAGEAKTVRTVLAIVGVLAVVSAVFTFVGKETVDEGAADEQVTLSDFEFDSESYSFAGGTSVLVRNDDPFLHTFTVEELDIDEVLSPGSEILVEIPSESGDYVLFCQPHTSDPDDPSEDDMAADLTIQ
jgi:Cupredoxin-like domain